ncbi:3312_t:CDS:2 [Dentiscutata heterogama]|uniref:3312_t:CDS:1 n=1 Tax=Dentiscutata heterogama TaxID=1316150 RepID=A0ACA9LMA4_9GLOM|nr:3312_t:CDS:2 [Dentiscutata heterogama]
MPHLTSCQKKARKAYEAKAHKHNANNSEAENFDGIGNLSVCDEVIEDNNIANTAQQYNHNSDNTEYYNNDDNLSAHNEPIKNDNTENIIKKLQDASENEDQLEEVDEDKEDIGGLLENEIELCNLYKKIPAAFENLALDIKKENVNSKIWVHLSSIRFYLQLVKNNHQKMKASKIIADAARKEVYHARCIHSWAYEYIMTY